MPLPIGPADTDSTPDLCWLANIWVNPSLEKVRKLIRICGSWAWLRGERERLFGSREREGKLEITFPFYGKGTRIRKCYGKGNLRLVIPGNPGNHIISKVKFKILFIFMPWPAIRKTANNDSISRPNSRPKLPFPGNGKGNYKMPREGKGREIWGLYSWESRETGIPARPWLQGAYFIPYTSPTYIVLRDRDMACLFDYCVLFVLFKSCVHCVGCPGLHWIYRSDHEWLAWHRVLGGRT